jgi:uncharacterized membrane protein YoaT (DUF817 family)
MWRREPMELILISFFDYIACGLFGFSVIKVYFHAEQAYPIITLTASVAWLLARVTVLVTN